ncbi:MetQ/NlpA family ABC transporter substrate-binding protein [uncultured Ruminococcus sp.]|uniref:MetQ/NlpA family ABC transporter substrate-binding protein n=1 Tax=uncultured Ruminococcus sp. TaxID=165186 RepID=UPI002930FE52|nr:MetQ/NlpA family ABC transporter substrate-binding protein [uncultured Ruminococcus sp.]
MKPALFCCYRSSAKNIEFAEIEAAQLPSALKDYDYAVINSNYAIDAGLNPVKDSLGIEGSASAYVNIIAVKEGNKNEPKIKALVAATESQKVIDYMSLRIPPTVSIHLLITTR